MTLPAAVSAFRAGRHADAEAICRRLLAGEERDEVRHLLGLCLSEQGRLSEAVAELERVQARRPQDVEVLRNLAIVQRRAGNAERALDLYQRLAAMLDEPADPLLQAAELAIDLDRIELAESLLQQVQVTRPGHPAALAALAQLREQQNDTAAARALAEQALAGDSGSFKAAFVLARLDQRSGTLDVARQRLQALLDRPLEPVNRSLVLSRLAEIERREGRPRQAFDLKTRANQALSALPRVQALRGTSVYGHPAVADLSAFFDEARLARWGRECDTGDRREPVFLVGFPRSGTTLLDRMLVAHPEVAVLEEQPTLAPILDRHGQGAAALAELEMLSAGDIRHLADRYHQQLPADARVVVDKMPLNSIYLPVICRVFPGARILFAVRDPRDVCLSCYFQSFALNEPMSHFLDWQQTGRYYHDVMNLALRARDLLPLKLSEVRYEALVRSPRPVMESLLDFLGLAWHPDMADFHRRVGQERINTPSYEQVIRPVHAEAVGRWRDYPAQLQQISPLLEPLIDRLGYRAV